MMSERILGGSRHHPPLLVWIVTVTATATTRTTGTEATAGDGGREEPLAAVQNEMEAVTAPEPVPTPTDHRSPQAYTIPISLPHWSSWTRTTRTATEKTVVDL